MRLPDLVAYQAAVQHPATAFADPELRAGRVATGQLGLPRAVTGNFAVTYQVQRGAQRWAVRCFHRDASDRPRRYAAIGQTLASLGEPFVPVTYLPLGVRVGQTWYPVTKMPWLDGVTLNRAVESRLATPPALADLERRIIDLVSTLRRHGLAHGDLQHGNILVEPSGALRLVDYDGMYVLALRGLTAAESGDPNYQHPGRSVQYDADLDRFSTLIIVVALRALAVAPGLWHAYNSGDNLLFRRADFVAPHRSALFRDLAALPSLHDLARRLVDVCQADYAQVPLLEDFLRLQPQLQLQIPRQLQAQLGPDRHRHPQHHSQPPRRGMAAPPPVARIPFHLRHVQVLNRLYGGTRLVAAKPRPAARGPAVQRSWQLRRAVTQDVVAFSADGTLVLTAGGDGALRARERAGGRTCYTWRNAGQIAAVACAEDGQRVLAIGADGSCSLWQLGSPDPLQRSSLGRSPLLSVAFGSHGPVVASARGDPNVLLLDLGSGQQRQLVAPGTPRCLVLAADGSRVALATSDGGLRCWSVASGRLVGAAIPSAPVTVLAISPDGTRLASADAAPGVQLWQVPGGRALARLETSKSVTYLAFGSGTLAAATRGGHIHVWDLGTGAVLYDGKGPAGAVSGLAVSPDGQCVAAITLDGVVWVRVLGASASSGRRRGRLASAPAVVAPAQPAGALGPTGWLRYWLRRVASVP